MSLSLHDVPREAFSYVWDNSLAPALEIAPGEAVELHARDASGGQIDERSSVADVGGIDFARVNPVSGPVYVRGALPGDVLAVEILELRPGGWGWTAVIPGFGLLSEEFTEPWLRISAIDAGARAVRFSERLTLPLAPFPGTIGVAPADAGEHPILPPTRWGGNLDTRHLTAGTTLYLPVAVEGALLSVGDTHAAQGDGEVCGTAIESAMDIALRVSVRRDMSLHAPQYDVPARPPAAVAGAAAAAGAAASASSGPYHVCTGVGPDLLEAAREATRAMIGWLGEQHGIAPYEAYALASVCCDLRIHELVDAPNWVVGLFLPLAVLAEA